MKLLIDIDDQLFNEVKKLTKAKKKRDAIIIPMQEYLELHKRNTLANMLGSFDLGMTLKDLKTERRKWKNT